MTVLATPNQLQHPRLGLAISRKVARSAVGRNRIKRVVRESYRTPWETFDTNLMGTVSVLDCIREVARPVVVICVTSDKCYENHEGPWPYRETDSMGGHDPYSASKSMAELAIAAYAVGAEEGVIVCRGEFMEPATILREAVAEAEKAGLLGEKIMLTEFIAYMSLGELIHAETAVKQNPGLLSIIDAMTSTS